MDAHYDSLLERVAAVVPVAGRVSRGDLYDLGNYSAYQRKGNDIVKQRVTLF